MGEIVGRGTRQIIARLGPAAHERLTVAAAQADVAPAEIIRRALDGYLADTTGHAVVPLAVGDVEALLAVAAGAVLSRPDRRALVRGWAALADVDAGAAARVLDRAPVLVAAEFVEAVS